MSIVKAGQALIQKPWGVADLEPWSGSGRVTTGPIGEIWYVAPDPSTTPSSLQLKILLTSLPLSIQVHPDDEFAKSIGLPRGKTEAWYVLSAAPGAKVALGLKQPATQAQLRNAVEDGSIAELTAWKNVIAGDVIFVPAGTIHAIGAGLVIAEIQQRSDATFRLFDHGSRRELHVENGLTVALASPAIPTSMPRRLTAERRLLVSCQQFVFELLALPSETSWSLDVEQETWCLVLYGDGQISSIAVGKGDCIFAQLDSADICTGNLGMTMLIAYSDDRPNAGLLQRQRHKSQSAEAMPIRAINTLVSCNQAVAAGDFELDGAAP